VAKRARLLRIIAVTKSVNVGAKYSTFLHLMLIELKTVFIWVYTSYKNGCSSLGYRVTLGARDALPNERPSKSSKSFDAEQNSFEVQ
jgi:hypothetical protein